jgi:hypothetical protein
MRKIESKMVTVQQATTILQIQNVTASRKKYRKSILNNWMQQAEILL